jgi:hypothetical protein
MTKYYVIYLAAAWAVTLLILAALAYTAPEREDHDDRP